MYGQLEQGRRSVGGQKKRFKDHLKVTLKSCDMNPDNLEALAEDRVGWREVCAGDLEIFNVKYIAAAEKSPAPSVACC